MSLVLRNETRKITPKKLILDRKCFKERHENCKDETKVQTMVHKTPHINLNIEQQEFHKNVDEIRFSVRVAFIHGVCYKISGILPKYKKKH